MDDNRRKEKANQAGVQTTAKIHSIPSTGLTIDDLRLTIFQPRPNCFSIVNRQS
jgi:hypothetical protein